MYQCFSLSHQKETLPAPRGCGDGVTVAIHAQTPSRHRGVAGEVLAVADGCFTSVCSTLLFHVANVSRDAART